MKNILTRTILIVACATAAACGKDTAELDTLWENPPHDAKPWVYWYWCNGAVSREGITADLEAMGQAGIGGAYIFTIDGIPETPLIEPSYNQLTPEWWDIMAFAVSEAERLGMHLGFNACDGWALAGGPWITPELSMQKVVWSETRVSGPGKADIKLPVPEHNEGYYRDIAVFAYPSYHSGGERLPTVKSNGNDKSPQFLATNTCDSKKIFRSESPCWIEYSFDEPFTCRSAEVLPYKGNYQAMRLILEASDDGASFRRVARLDPPRHGWQWDGTPCTYSIPETTARYFRFVFDPACSEPGSEDLDKAKWAPVLEVLRLRLSPEPRIHHYESKNGQTWRLAPYTSPDQLPDPLCLPKEKLLMPDGLTPTGSFLWDVPAGDWTILRMGHTSTGNTNGPAGGASGLECDKFNPEALEVQFNAWLGRVAGNDGKGSVSPAVRLFHTDSWECASQNWSPVMAGEFLRRRGYDIIEYLPVLVGIPIESVRKSEEVLMDMRKTISELVTETFMGGLREKAMEYGCLFSAECSAPTMMSDGMMIFRDTDIPMGEFWLRSPTHDKPNDILDAVSGARIYGKNIVQAEAFTQRRITWDEHPAMLKTMQDMEYSFGVNRLVYHVFTHNPWIDRAPGLTLSDGIGLFFQRDQTWWTDAAEWVSYATRCQALLQFGKPVSDLAVFAGDNLPSRAVLPERLVPFLPGIFGHDVVASERERLSNHAIPMTGQPGGTAYAANTAKPDGWANALRGYNYDSFNADALLNRATVKNKRLVLPDGVSYGVLIIPGRNPMMPDAEMSAATLARISEFAAEGLPVLSADTSIATYMLPYVDSTFDRIGIGRDLIALDEYGEYAKGLAFSHRSSDDTDIYFIANQSDKTRELHISLRISGRVPELWYPASGEVTGCPGWESAGGRTIFKLRFAPCESVFVVLRNKTKATSGGQAVLPATFSAIIPGPWTVRFDPERYGGPAEGILFDTLYDWSVSPDERIKYYSGTAVYSASFEYYPNDEYKYYIELDKLYNTASIKINGNGCGTLWTPPYRREVTKALVPRTNRIEIAVTNTWANRIIGDSRNIPYSGKRVWTNAKFTDGITMQKSGIVGQVRIISAGSTD